MSCVVWLSERTLASADSVAIRWRGVRLAPAAEARVARRPLHVDARVLDDAALLLGRGDDLIGDRLHLRRRARQRQRGPLRDRRAELPRRGSAARRPRGGLVAPTDLPLPLYSAPRRCCPAGVNAVSRRWAEATASARSAGLPHACSGSPGSHRVRRRRTANRAHHRRADRQRHRRGDEAAPANASRPPLTKPRRGATTRARRRRRGARGPRSAPPAPPRTPASSARRCPHESTSAASSRCSSATGSRARMRSSASSSASVGRSVHRVTPHTSLRRSIARCRRSRHWTRCSAGHGPASAFESARET